MTDPTSEPGAAGARSADADRAERPDLADVTGADPANVERTPTNRIPMVPGITPRRAWAAIAALAIGGFTIGTTEFVTMGVLPQIAADLGVSEPSAALGISAYALGVVVGVPIIAILGARLPRKGLLLALMLGYAVCNALSAAATSLGIFVAARFLDGLPHGAFFGVASLVAASVVPKAQRGRAIAAVLMGLSIANVVGVPAATWIGQALGWRAAYIACVAVGAVAILGMLVFVPRTPGSRDTSPAGEVREFFGRPQVWLTLAAGAFGFGGLFAVYSYIATTVTDVGGLPQGAVPVFLLAFGLGMVAGTWLGGEVSAWVMRSLVVASIASAALMLAFWAVAPFGWWVLPVVFCITATGSVLVTNLQIRLMDVAGRAVTLGAAMNHASLNTANALGAWLGGLVIAAGFGYRSPALVAFALALLGIGILALSALLERRSAGAARNG